MCGISGFVQSGTARDDLSPAEAGRVAEAMAVRIRHRGPDATGVWVDPDGLCALGHARLRVIDLKTGAQPLANEDETVWVVFNGEIYNHRELRTLLEARGHRFKTRSDTEVIVHGWEEWGPAVTDHLDGMFAFALWDGNRRTLLLARDRCGKKPLFVVEGAGGVVFGSEPKALAAHPGTRLSIDPARIPEYLAYGYVPTPGTLFKGVRKVPPGTRMLWTREGGLREETYWSITFRGNAISEAEAREETRTLLTAAVDRRLEADVPLGAFLSGGVDSSIIVGLMSRAMSRPVQTFSIGFEDAPEYDETPYAAMVAEKFGTEHTAFRVGPQSVDLIDRLVWSYDEPFGDSSAIPTSIVSGLAREKVTVALTGDGGDELFAGYPRFRGFQLSERLPGWMWRSVRRAGSLLPPSDDFRSLPRRAQRFLTAAALPPDERMLRWIGFLPGALSGLLQPGALEAMDRDSLLESFRAPLGAAAGGSALDRVLTLNFRTYLLDDLLVKADRSSMLHSLELRSPFLDTALVEFATGLPDRLRIRGRRQKVVLVDAFRDLLPEAIIRRPKWGFGIPLPTWLRGPWRQRVEDLLGDPEALLYQWLRPEPVGGLVAEHLDGSADHGHALWALLTLETWLRAHGEDAGQ